MTREEYEDEALPYIEKQYRRIIISYVDGLEQRIKELETHNKELSKDFTHSKYVSPYKELENPKNCEGCKWEKVTNMDYNYTNCCGICIRNCNDYYEPKER